MAALPGSASGRPEGELAASGTVPPNLSLAEELIHNGREVVCYGVEAIIQWVWNEERGLPRGGQGMWVGSIHRRGRTFLTGWA